MRRRRRWRSEEDWKSISRTRSLVIYYVREFTCTVCCVVTGDRRVWSTRLWHALAGSRAHSPHLVQCRRRRRAGFHTFLYSGGGDRADKYRRRAHSLYPTQTIKRYNTRAPDLTALPPPTIVLSILLLLLYYYLIPRRRTWTNSVDEMIHRWAVPSKRPMVFGLQIISMGKGKRS